MCHVQSLTPLVTCSLPVIYVCLSIRLETKPRGSIDGPTSSDKNLSRRPLITETNLFRFISTLILSRTFLTPSHRPGFSPLSKGTRNHLSNQGLSHFCNILDCGEYFGEKIRETGNCVVVCEMSRSKQNAKNLKEKLWQKRRTYATNKFKN